MENFPLVNFLFFVLVGFLCILKTDTRELGKLDCTEKDGLKPDSKLLNLIVSKCQPKQGQSERMIAACLMKCLMKQNKAVDKKGKLKLKKAVEICTVFPDKFKENVTARFDHCAAENNPRLKKEPNGCESWVGFAECFYEFGKHMCPTERERKAWATSTTTTTEASVHDSTTQASDCSTHGH